MKAAAPSASIPGGVWLWMVPISELWAGMGVLYPLMEVAEGEEWPWPNTTKTDLNTGALTVCEYVIAI